MENTFSRPDGRTANSLRRVRITPGVMKHAEGSVLVEFGDTRVLCAVSIEDKVPPFLMGKGQGWLTAEYAMLPRATETRNQRDSTKGKPNSRSLEIQRLIGRSLRGVLELKNLGERTLWIDCDVIQADGGTRTAAITGTWVALVQALNTLRERKQLSRPVIKGQVAAVSVGQWKNTPILDLCYLEDKDAEVDMNVVMMADGNFVEVQGTGESATFSRQQLGVLLDLAEGGITQLHQRQLEVVTQFTHYDRLWIKP